MSLRESGEQLGVRVLQCDEVEGMHVDVEGVVELTFNGNLLKSSHFHLLEILPELELEDLDLAHTENVAVGVEMHEVADMTL